ncbi:hypothetical protein RFI_00400, partial [Reticulomyxa filosa]
IEKQKCTEKDFIKYIFWKFLFKQRIVMKTRFDIYRKTFDPEQKKKLEDQVTNAEIKLKLKIFFYLLLIDDVKGQRLNKISIININFCKKLYFEGLKSFFPILDSNHAKLELL